MRDNKPVDNPLCKRTDEAYSRVIFTAATAPEREHTHADTEPDIKVRLGNRNVLRVKQLGGFERNATIDGD